MNCDACGSAFSDPVVGAVPYACGLPVILNGIPVRNCSGCDNYAFDVPRILELHRVLAQAVAMAPGRVTAAEFRFLRKYLGWSSTDCARRFAVDRATLSRWENCQREIPGPAQGLIRVAALCEQPVEDYNSHDALVAAQQPRSEEWTLAASYDTDGWHSAC